MNIDQYRQTLTTDADALEGLRVALVDLELIEERSRANWTGYAPQAAMYELRADIELAQRRIRNLLTRLENPNA